MLTFLVEQIYELTGPAHVCLFAGEFELRGFVLVCNGAVPVQIGIVEIDLNIRMFGCRITLPVIVNEKRPL